VLVALGGWFLGKARWQNQKEGRRPLIPDIDGSLGIMSRSVLVFGDRYSLAAWSALGPSTVKIGRGVDMGSGGINQ